MCMKKWLTRWFACMLMAAMVFAMAACGGENSNTESSQSNTSSRVETSSKDSSSQEASKDASTTASSEASDPAEDSSEDASSDTSSTGEETAPDFIENFVSIGTVDVNVRATSNNAIRLTGVDVESSYGAIVLYTSEYGLPDELPDFAVAIFTYDKALFGYVKTAFYAAGETVSEDVPDDGFAIAAHTMQETYITRLQGIDAETTVFPHGLHIYNGLDYTVKKATSKPVIDGKFSEDEWKAYRIDDVDAENESWSYAQFEKDNYYSTASYYTTYDDEYLYLCVVVSSPYHYCPISTSQAGNMWQYECIQVKMSSQSPDGEYILKNYDHVINGTAVSEGVVRSYGFACNDEGETCYYESGAVTTFTGLCACSRDDAEQQTVYEVAFAWSEFDLTPESGMRLGLTFSINSTNADDVAKGVWKNITYRCGGGVIGRNDWSKMPVITLE